MIWIHVLLLQKKDVTFALWPLRFLLQLEILEGFVLRGEVFYFSFKRASQKLYFWFFEMFRKKFEWLETKTQQVKRPALTFFPWLRWKKQNWNLEILCLNIFASSLVNLNLGLSLSLIMTLIEQIYLHARVRIMTKEMAIGCLTSDCMIIA